MSRFLRHGAWVPVVVLMVVGAVTSVEGKTLVGVVSDRSAADLATGADHFLQQYPGHQLIFRSVSQLAQMTDEELRALFAGADAVLVLAVFGDAAVRLQDLMNPFNFPVILVIHSASSLIGLSRDRNGFLFQGFGEDQLQKLTQSPHTHVTLDEWVRGRADLFPRQELWVRAKGYWQAGEQEDIANLLGLILKATGADVHLGAMTAGEHIRVYQNSHRIRLEDVSLQADRPWIAILDHDRGDRTGNVDLIHRLCTLVEQERYDCLSFFARWGESSTQALTLLEQRSAKAPLIGIISLQDFVIGGGESREQAVERLIRLNVPVFKGIRLFDRTRQQWLLAPDGLPRNSVHYRLAMPELQGIGQPLVLAVAAESHLHPSTGLQVNRTEPVPEQIERMVQRVKRWFRLRTTSNADKRVAIVYYNHPPGRHNIGADNLDVPASLLNILRRMKREGYTTGELPPTPQALLDLIQDRGVNLPEDAEAMRHMSKRVTTLNDRDYAKWFAALPSSLQAEMEQGPLGYLHEGLRTALESNDLMLAVALLERVLRDVRHVLEGAAGHPGRDRARTLLEQLETAYRAIIGGGGNWEKASVLNRAIRETSIEGLRGWGQAPGRVMVYDERILIPGLRFGNIFIGPQPPRGWELHEELLHANTTFPPTHQYWAFYAWLMHEFQADALVHLGRHSTYEFLPRHGTGVSDLDYSWHMAGELPGIYPYIVDGVGEGIQAKRRGLAVMVSHLTPPLSTTELYDDLLGLRQLVESYEMAGPDPDNPAKVRAVAALRDKIGALDLREELAVHMAEELRMRGIGFEEADDDLLVHETGHYLTVLQEHFMPLGLHVFGRDWDDTAVDTMMASITGKRTERPGDTGIRHDLTSSPAEERRSFFTALNGGFVKPGKGNDPIRTPEVLPTGRNFHALDGSLLPTRLGFELGKELAVQARAGSPASPDGKESVILWATDAVRDEGAIIAFGLDMLGLEPVWNSRGILTGIQRVLLAKNRERRDVVFVTSGLFRDLYGEQLEWLDKGVLLALDGAASTIRQKEPSLIPALEAALAPLGALATGGKELLDDNRVAAHWIRETKALLQEGVVPEVAGRQGSIRVFGAAPGAYGAGVNRLVERSGSWENRAEIADVYLDRMGHAYGVGFQGEPMRERFSSNVARIEHTYLGRASHLYGLLDNNDGFDYLGGLSLAVEILGSTAPRARIVHHADPAHSTVVDLDKALLTEFRGRFLNPQWLKPLMRHEYAGARTMGSEFLEFLWGWQVTNPDMITSAMWNEVKSVYIDDRYDLGLSDFLEYGHNVHVKANMLAIMLVAAQKGFWKADEATVRELSDQFVDLVAIHGLPGSGHTRPDHPLFDWMGPRLDRDQREKLESVLERARVQTDPVEPMMTAIAEILVAPESHASESAPDETGGGVYADAGIRLWVVWIVVLACLLLGVLRGSRKPVELSRCLTE